METGNLRPEIEPPIINKNKWKKRVQKKQAYSFSVYVNRDRRKRKRVLLCFFLD